MNWNQLLQTIQKIIAGQARDRDIKEAVRQKLLNSCGRAPLNDGCYFNGLYHQLANTSPTDYQAIFTIAEAAAMHAVSKPTLPLNYCCRLVHKKTI